MISKRVFHLSVQQLREMGLWEALCRLREWSPEAPDFKPEQMLRLNQEEFDKLGMTLESAE